MKALIRGNEVITEPFSPWVIANIKWMTGTETDGDGNPIGGGDGWTLVENYEPPKEVKE